MKAKSTPPKTVDEYIGGYPQNVQAILQEIRRIVRDAVPAAQETIKYQIPTFVLGENLLHFAGFKKHIGFYPTPSGIRHFKDALASYPTAKGSVQFPLDRSMPYALIRKIAQFRAKEARERTAAKRRKP
jgi:uncharacterized protein YdhG (YjbR/CyaY superfamily)